MRLDRKLLLVVNHLEFLYSHRLSLLTEALDAGVSVQVICYSGSNDLSQHLKKLGVDVNIKSETNSRSNYTVAGLVSFIGLLIRALDHNSNGKAVVFITLPMILSGHLLRVIRSRGQRQFNLFSGLGHMFTDSRRRSLFSLMLAQSFRLLFRTFCLLFNDRYFFQNWMDLKEIFPVHNSRKIQHIGGVGVDLNVYTPSPKVKLSDSTTTVVMIGRRLYDKGFDDFCDVAREVCVNYPDVQFKWIGARDRTNPSDVGDLNNCQDAIRQLRLVDHLCENQILTELRNSALLLFLSKREGCPKAVMEASATGIPTVVYDVPGCNEVVRDGINGRIIPVNDVRSVTDAVIEILFNQALRQRYRCLARSYAEQHFDNRKKAKMHLDLIFSRNLSSVP